jgi:hypothetical protein
MAKSRKHGQYLEAWTVLNNLVPALQLNLVALVQPEPVEQ